MSRGRLTSTPSGGQSEVLDSLRYEGAIHSGLRIDRLSVMVSNRWQGDDDRAGSDPQFLTDVQAVIAALATAGFVHGNDATGAAVDLTASQPSAAFVSLTGTGRAQARHPRPRPRVLRG